MTTATDTPSTAAATERFERLPLGMIVPSKTNPRSHFDETYLEQLAASISEKGMVEPLLVRPLKKADTFEIVAGECRYRASVKALLQTAPCLIRTLTDEQAIELQLIENLHRKDLTPLEEAGGFRALIKSNPDKHSAASIASRIGKSPSWVWDLMKLLDLIIEAKQLLEQGRMTAGHAILIARLKPEDQKRAIHPDTGGLFEGEDAEFPEFDARPGEKRSRYDGHKMRTINELKDWIGHHIRFDVAHAAKAAPLQFEPVAQQVEAAAAKPGRGKKVVPITYDYNAQSEAAKAEDERTYGSTAWKRADGQDKSKSCAFAVRGVVVAGTEHYGESFEVCIARDKCTVHWGNEIKQREKTQKLRESGQTKKVAKSEAAYEAKQRREESERKRRADRWNAFKPALQKAALEVVGTFKGGKLPGKVFAAVLKELDLPATTTAATLPYALLGELVHRAFDHAYGHYDEPNIVRWAKVLGVNVKACEPKAESVQKSGVSPKKTKKGKAAA